MKRESFTIRLLPDIFKKIKVLAAQKGTTISALIEEALQDMLKKYKVK